MLTPVIPPFRRRRRAKAARALTLLAATYQPGVSVRLTFDRPVNISAVNAQAVFVADGPFVGARYQGSGSATLFDPATVQVPLVELEVFTGVDVRLSAGPDTGIIAADDGGKWPGATNLLLPFP